MVANERESRDGKSNPAEAAGESLAQKSFILHTDPFTVFRMALLGAVFSVVVVLAIVSWIRDWLRQLEPFQIIAIGAAVTVPILLQMTLWVRGRMRQP